MKTAAITLALLLAACANPFLTQAERGPVPTLVTERWSVEFAIDAPALAPRPAVTKAKRVSPEMVRLSTLAAMPALDRDAIMRAFDQETKRLFRELPISIRFNDPTANQRMVVNHESKGGRLLGLASGIDHMNRKKNGIKLWLGTLVNVMRHDPTRQHKDPNEAWAAPTDYEVGIALARLVAHEVGHCLGLRHNPNETNRDRFYIMSSSAWAFSPSAKNRPFWSLRNRVYLFCVLEMVPLPKWITDRRPDDDGGDSSHVNCPHCTPKIGK